jgi:O-antigen/teichoic acid export membrane protein
LITVGLLLAAACGAIMGLLYVLATPIVAPRLAFIEHRPALGIGFVLLTAAAAVNLLTDSVFIASRKAGYNALVDGGLCGLAKVFAGVILIGTGTYGLYCASVSGFAVATLASLLLMIMVLRCRPSLRKPFQTLKPLLRFSGANYAGNVLILIPDLVVPLIVLDRRGASAAAYFFVAFQVANLLYSAGNAVEAVLLAEGSHAGTDSPELLRRSRRLLMALCPPACLVLIMGAHWLLLLTFGMKYSQHGTSALILLAVAAIPLAAVSWSQAVLRLSGRLRAIVLSSGVYAVAICGLAWFLAPHGLTALTAAWPIGGLLGAVVAAVAMPHKAPPRHRRTDQTRKRGVGSLR